MKTIIVATDFSSNALNASIYALKMAQIIKADVLLFNVYELMPNFEDPIIVLNIVDLKVIAENDIESFKNELVKITATKLNILTQVKLGVFANELNEICDNIKPYLLIMGSQGKTAAERIMFGGHTANALKNCTWPLITVPYNASFSAFKNIGIGYDFKNEINEDFIAEIKLLANDFNSNIHILNAAKEDEFDGDFILLSNKISKMFETHKVEFHFVEGEHIDKSIVEFAEKNNINLLIVMRMHHSLWEKIISRSHTKQMVLHSHVPVLLLR